MHWAFGRNRKGLTLTELIVVAGLIMMIATVALRAVSLASGRERVTKCGSTLRSLGQALMMYSNDNRGHFPRTLYVVGAPPTAYTGEACNDPFNTPGTKGTPPQANDVTAAIYLLLRAQDISSEIFVCPLTSYEKDKFGGGTNTGQDRSNFSSKRDTLSYSMANPYPDAAALAKGYKWNSTLGADFAIMADMNPGGATLPTLSVNSPYKEIQKGNSRNHGGEGQNVMYGDGHVEWQQTSFVGVDRDNIYTVSSGRAMGNSATIEGSPSWQGDSVLLPVVTVDPGYIDGLSENRRYLNVIIGGGVVLVAIIALVTFVLAKKRRRARVAGANAAHSG